jgi:hypothetical protein
MVQWLSISAKYVSSEKCSGSQHLKISLHGLLSGGRVKGGRRIVMQISSLEWIKPGNVDMDTDERRILPLKVNGMQIEPVLVSEKAWELAGMSILRVAERKVRSMLSGLNEDFDLEKLQRAHTVVTTHDLH